MGADPMFAGLRVVELAGDPAGEAVGRTFAQLGADVVKVEPPSGSPTRAVGPFAHGREDGDHSLTFWYQNRNKRSVVVDHTTAEGRATVLRLAAGADVVVTTLGPAEAEATGLTVDALAAASGRLVVVSVTPFGLTGPWSGWASSDLVGLALGSPLHSCGYDDHTIPPIRPGGDQGYLQAASFARMAVMLALVERERTGRGQVVDVAMHDALAVGAELANPYWFYARAVVQRQTCRHATPFPTGPSIFRCADGRWVFFAVFIVEQKAWQAILGWLAGRDLAADLSDPEYGDPAFRQASLAHVLDVVADFFLTLTADEAYHEGQARGLAVGPVNLPDDLFEDEHLAAREFFVTVDHDDVPPARYPGVPFRFAGVPAASPVRAPRLGEHDDEVLHPTPPAEEAT